MREKEFEKYNQEYFYEQVNGILCRKKEKNIRGRIATMNDNNIRACWLELAAYLSITQISTETWSVEFHPY